MEETNSFLRDLAVNSGWCSREEDLDYERHGGIGVCDIFCEGDEVSNALLSHYKPNMSVPLPIEGQPSRSLSQKI